MHDSLEQHRQQEQVHEQEADIDETMFEESDPGPEDEYTEADRMRLIKTTIHEQIRRNGRIED